jgi:hypothetical protein
MMTEKEYEDLWQDLRPSFKALSPSFYRKAWVEAKSRKIFDELLFDEDIWKTLGIHPHIEIEVLFYPKRRGICHFTRKPLTIQSHEKE